MTITVLDPDTVASPSPLCYYTQPHPSLARGGSDPQLRRPGQALGKPGALPVQVEYSGNLASPGLDKTLQQLPKALEIQSACFPSCG